MIFFSPMTIPIRQIEIKLGHTLIEDAPWLDRKDWNNIILSKDGNAIRLVLLDAKVPGEGAMTRLIVGILNAGHIPVIVEPLGNLKLWCKRKKWKRRIVRQGEDRHEIWIYRGE